jgi:hypothetical protein
VTERLTGRQETAEQSSLNSSGETNKDKGPLTIYARTEWREPWDLARCGASSTARSSDPSAPCASEILPVPRTHHTAFSLFIHPLVRTDSKVQYCTVLVMNTTILFWFGRHLFNLTAFTESIPDEPMLPSGKQNLVSGPTHEWLIEVLPLAQH